MPDADVVIVPSIPEWEEASTDYIEASEQIRHDLDLSAKAVDRGVPHSGADIPDFVPLGVLIYLSHKLGDAVVDALLERVINAARRRKSRRWSKDGRAEVKVIFGPGGEVLRRVTVDPKDDED